MMSIALEACIGVVMNNVYNPRLSPTLQSTGNHSIPNASNSFHGLATYRHGGSGFIFATLLANKAF